METLRFLMVSTHFPPSHLGGDATFVEYLSKELAARGHEVHVSFNPSSYRLLRGGEKRRWPVVTADGVHLHPYLTRFGRTGPVFSLLSGMSGGATRRTMELAETVRPDVVHWHNTKGFVERPFGFRDALTLYTSHDYFSVCPRSNLIKPDHKVCDNPTSCQTCLLNWRKPPQLWRTGGNRVILFDDMVKVLAPSRFVRDRLMRDGITVDRVIGNFVPDPGRSTVQTDLDERNLILYIGMLEPHKGPKTLLRAFHRTAGLQGFDLAIVGEGSQRKELKMLVSRYGLESRVNVPGFVPGPALQTLLKKAAVVAVPSEWYEVFGLVAIEAFSRGIPVIGSNIGALPEVLSLDSGSSLFRTGDVEDLGRVINDAWDGRDNLPERGRKARTTYERRYSPEQHLRQYFDLMDSLAED